MRSEVKEAVAVKAERVHCYLLDGALDEEGREFIRRHWDVEPLDGLLEAFERSPLCWSIFVDGEIAGMFGCTDEGQAWLTTAPAIEKVRLRFIRQSGPYIKKMLEAHGSVYSYAHRDNALLLRWLAWAGFEVVGEMGEFKVCVCQWR